MAKNSKSGWVLYLMLHVPAVCFCKIGITGKSAAKRAKGLDRAMLGFPVPIFFCIVPGAYHIEQWLHGSLRGLRAKFYHGDGASEWFWVLAAPFALAVMAGIWTAEAALAYAAWLLFENP